MPKSPKTQRFLGDFLLKPVDAQSIGSYLTAKENMLGSVYRTFTI